MTDVAVALVLAVAALILVIFVYFHCEIYISLKYIITQIT